MSSPLENQILKIRKMVSEDRNLFSKGKKAERMVEDNIIRPILRKLGWTEGGNHILYQIEVKLSRRKGEADLVLTNAQNKHILAIESKKLGEPVSGKTQTFENHMSQLIEYLVSLQREFGLLTDGEWWHLIKRKGYDWETVWLRNLLTDDLNTLLHDLSYITPKNSENLQHRIEKEQEKAEILSKEWRAIQEDKEIQLKVFTDLLLSRIQSSYDNVSVEFDEIHDFVKRSMVNLKQISYDFPKPDSTPKPSIRPGPTRPRPGSRISLQNDSFDILKAYRNIVRLTGEWLALKGWISQKTLTHQRKLFPSRLPIIVKADNLESAKEQMKIAGHSGIRELENMRGWYLDSNHSPNNCVNRARDLLEMCGRERTLLKLNDILIQDLKTKK